MENRDTFMRAGGTRYEYIPCLNADSVHLDALAAVISDELHGWLGQDHDADTSARLARDLGAAQ